ncbi:MAG: UMP kinase [Nanoarchaeota archaeon]
MQKKVVVLSLGGSLIIPDEVDADFLKKFKKIIKKNTKRYKFVIVCGGGIIARKYIKGLEKAGILEHLQGLIGIASTRINARFMNYFFNQDSEKGIPHDVKDIKRILLKKNFVFCGALTYKIGATTDAQAAELAISFKSPFINLTNVSGLHDKNPLKHKDAKLIPEISWKNFNKMANLIKFKPGQHFVLDQRASGIIMKNKIKTYILGEDLKQFENVLQNKKFKGTVIEG